MLVPPRLVHLMLLATAVVIAGNGQPAAFAAEEAAVDYTRDIKPILSNACYTCHGPDEATREAGFRLDDRGSAIEWVVTPGASEASELIARISSDDPEMRMPPLDSKRPPLSVEQVELLRRWIDQGAKFDEHWAYVPPRRPEVPSAAEGPAAEGPADDGLAPIDAFVHARLEKEKILPSPRADRRTLIRRLSFDLTGLPPTAEQVSEFLADSSPEAYQRLVDRLLDSEHYGERMAIHWLDLVRYADSVGIHGDQEWSMSPYRDYVIRAFNDNMPFDRFTVEQLAGDLLPEPTLQQRIASGYNRLNMITAEGGAQANEYLAKYAADRVRTTSTVWMGATLGCAECHDHKFDPYTAKDFYSFAAFFADLEEKGVYNGSSRSGEWGANVVVPTDEQAARLVELDGQIAATKKVLNQPTAELAAAQAKWESTLGERAGWQILEAVELTAVPNVSLQTRDDGSIVASGENPANVTYTLTFAPGARKVTALRLEVLADDSLPSRGPGRAGNGNFVLNGVKLRADDQAVELSAASATHAQESWPIDSLLGGSQKNGKGRGKTESNRGWAILPQVGKPNQAVFETAEDLALTADSKLTLELEHRYGSSHAIGRFRVSVIDAPRPVRAGEDAGVPDDLRALAQVPHAKRTSEQSERLAAYFRSITPQLADARQQLAQLEQARQTLADSLTTSLVSVSVSPREMRILPRGNWMDDSGEVVLPGVPAFLATAASKEIEGDDSRQTRLDLAHWMVDPQNPLVARVFVNRLWKLCFGQGLVASPGDFGSQGSVPSHPQLLDWLATEFVASGWDVKHIMRLIVLSETYRQAAQVRPALLQQDPLNKLLARQGRFRLPAEMIRDNALAVSGLLVKQVGGVSARPYQPAGYWSHLNFPTREYQRDSGSGLYRRGLYTHWQRTFLHPSLAAFDAPTREECTVERTVSNTPLQALVLMNDPTYVEAARALAVRILQQKLANDQDRIEFAFQQSLQRSATPEEVEVLVELYQNHRQQYVDDPAAAEAFNAVGEYRAPQEIDPLELAAWSSVSRAILNLHEMINRY